MEDKNIKENEISVHDVLNKIKDGILDPRSFSKENRQACVETLTLEGLQVSSIAALLKKSDKTISRDIKEINLRNGLLPNVDFVKEMVGRFLKMSLNHHGYLMRIARNKEATISERALSEASAWKVLEGTIQRLQTLGYLPTKPQAIVGDIFHHVEKADFDEFARQIIEIEKITDGDAKIEKDIKEDITKMKAVLEKIRPSEKDNNHKEEVNEDPRN